MEPNLASLAPGEARPGARRTGGLGESGVKQDSLNGGRGAWELRVTRCRDDEITAGLSRGPNTGQIGTRWDKSASFKIIGADIWDPRTRM